MGVAIPQVITEDKASGALVIDGGLRFDSSKSQYLSRTLTTAGNRRTWTASFWFKKGKQGNWGGFFHAGDTDSQPADFIYQYSDDTWYIQSRTSGGSDEAIYQPTQVFRDTGWYHVVIAVDTTQATESERQKIYINGQRVTNFASTNGYSQDYQTEINSTTYDHRIGRTFQIGTGTNYYIDGQFTQYYFIDGQALDPSYFGYTDPLTNTWRPKKLKSGAATINDGRTWSSNYGNLRTAGTQTNPFDADNTNYAQVSVGGGGYFTFPDGLNGRLEVLASTGQSSDGASTQTVTISNNSGSVASRTTSKGYNTGPEAIDFGVVSGITSVFLTDSGLFWGFRINSITLRDGVTETIGFGTNGFYLPFDGNSPIGQDRSGRGNNWTPVNFGGSNTIEKATGALPILNTDGGGKVARVGVRTDTAVGVGATCVLALPLVGIKSDFSNAVNSGTSNKTVNNISNNTTFSSSFSNFYGGSASFNGSNTVLNAGSSTDFQLATNFTVEFWVYLNSTSNSSLVSYYYYTDGDQERGWIISISSNKIRFRNSFGGVEIITSNTVSTSRWYHIAAVINGGTSQIYINGVADGSSGNIGTPDYSNANLTIGAAIYANQPSGYSSYLNGYIQDVRIYKGVAKYTQNFIPASTDPDILPDTPSGVAYSSTLSLPTSNEGGSLMFDGSGDYLRFSQSSDWAFGTGDFSIEYFIFPNYTTDTLGFGGTRGAAGTSAGWNIGLINEDTAGGYIQMYSNGGIAPTNAYCKIPYRKWTHVVYTRSGSTIRAIIDGVLYNTASNSQDWTLNDFSIGITGAGAAEPYLGFLSNIRIIKGSIPTSYQTSSTTLGTKIFNVPTSPLTTTSQGATSGDVKFLGCNSLTAITDFTVTPNTPTVNGNVSVSVFNPFTVNINTQRGQESGYATLNPLANPDGTLSNGNLTWSSTTTQDSACASTIYVNSGKWYWEITDVTGTGALNVGISKDNDNLTPTPGTTAGGYYYLASAYKYNNNNISVYGSTWTTGDVISAALDMDAGTVTFYKNGVSQGVAYSGLSGYFSPSIGDGGQSTAASGSINFGQKPFKFPPPTGFQPLALANTPRPTIARPDQYVGVTTYTGNGSLLDVTGLNFDADFLWIKSRGADVHVLTDKVRGDDGTRMYVLCSNLTASESARTESTTAVVKSSSWPRGGFRVGSNGQTNSSGQGYVAWAWKAGGNSNTYNINDIGYSTASAAGLTAGTITPTGASVNTKSGFSIIGYTGTGANATISHGLGNAPSFIIIKKRTSSPGDTNWRVYHSALGNTQGIYLSDTAAAFAASTFWNNTSPTSSVFSLGSDDGLNASSQTHIAYLWAEIPGFSKFGSYTGNGSTDGPMVVTGFRPRWILTKGSSYSQYWTIIDTGRDTYNPAKSNLWANASLAEDTSTTGIDILSNGFKPRTSANYNNSGETHIYAAFAETPSFNLYGGQSNAR